MREPQEEHQQMNGLAMGSPLSLGGPLYGDAGGGSLQGYNRQTFHSALLPRFRLRHRPQKVVLTPYADAAQLRIRENPVSRGERGSDILVDTDPSE